MPQTTSAPTQTTVERRELRRRLAREVETHLASFSPTSDTQSPEDQAEVTRQLAFVTDPLVKKLRRAQGLGKQTGRIAVDAVTGTMDEEDDED